MKHVVVLTTGGAITTRQNQTAGAGGSNATPDLLSLLPRNEIELTFEEFSNVPSSHFMPVNALKLAQRVESVLMSPEVQGVVVTHGTDTLEETAYLLDLTTNASKPVVVTGSVRQTNRPDCDSMLNLANAIRVAASSLARDLGVLLVFDGEIHAASQAQKLYTQPSHAFTSPCGGPLGRIDAHNIWFYTRPARRQYIPCSRLEESVDLIRLTQGGDDRQIRHSIEDQVGGVVIEVFGSGRVPPWLLPPITDALTRRIVVAITSRCLYGSLGDDYGYVGAYHDLQRLGVLLVHNLSGIKTRIKLMVALGAARNNEELRTWFKP